jgi:hypothetical protein
MISQTKYKQLRAKGDRVTKREMSQMEVYDFVQDAPKKYLVFVKRNLVSAGVVDNGVIVTTYTGQILGYGRLGKHYFNRNSRRYTITFTAINGVKYKGTYYASSGNYAKVRRVNHE